MKRVNAAVADRFRQAARASLPGCEASKNATAGQTIPVATASQTTSAGVVESRQGVVVDVGKPGAKATIDIYADFLCPICGEFQKQYGTQIEQQINAGTLQVNYHMVPLLNSRSNPPGYSLDSANAALAAANAGSGDESDAAALAALADQLPNLVGMMAEIAHDDPDSTLGWCDDQTEFEFGLDLILDGLDGMR